MGRFGNQSKIVAYTLAGLLTEGSFGGSLCGQQPDVVFRTDTRLVRMLATVKNASGELVSTLSKEDFTISDNGVSQQIAVFERQSAQPLSISLLLDTSWSTRKDQKITIDSASRFLNALIKEGNPDNTAALYTFNGQVTLRSTFTRDFSKLEQGLKDLDSDSGSSIYDAIYLASRDLGRREGPHIIVIVTDGTDTTSKKKFRDAVEALQRADVVFYSVVLVPVTASAGRNTGGEHALATVAELAGGRAFTPTGNQLDASFAGILEAFKTQYYLAYYPRGVAQGDRNYHKVKIELPARTDLRVSARSGYYGDTGR